MNDTVGMEVTETDNNVKNLAREVGAPFNVARRKPTRLSRSIDGFLSIYCNSSLPGIQTETNWRGVVVTPRSGTMFGWSRRFHTTASLKKAYVYC